MASNPGTLEPMGPLFNAAAFSQRRMTRALGDAFFAAVMVLGRAISPRD
jgi:hypothetical protein